MIKALNLKEIVIWHIPVEISPPPFDILGSWSFYIIPWNIIEEVTEKLDKDGRSLPLALCLPCLLVWTISSILPILDGQLIHFPLLSLSSLWSRLLYCILSSEICKNERLGDHYESLHDLLQYQQIGNCEEAFRKQGESPVAKAIRLLVRA